MFNHITQGIAGILSAAMLFAPFGFKNKVDTALNVGGVKTVTVEAGGAHSTIESARDYIRTLDKSKYSGIEVVIKSGVYAIDKVIEFTEEDSGTKDCPIKYVAEDGTTLTGGVYLTAADFAPASGEVSEYFPEDSKGHVAMTDISSYGFGKEYVEKKYALQTLNGESFLPLYKNGELQTICRYPNDSYVYFISAERVMADETKPMVERYVIEAVLDDEVIDHIASWHDITPVFTEGHHTFLWRQNNFKLYGIDTETNKITMPYPYTWDTLGYVPIPGRPMFFTNIPEELDMPGEYYLDANGMLYVYKTDDFASSTFSIPVTDTAISVKDADYLTFENIGIVGFSGSAMLIYADNVTVKDCEICGSMRAITMDGYNNTVRECDIHDIQYTAIDVKGGDSTTLTRSGTVITENEIHEWGQVYPMYECAVKIGESCGITVSHNDLHDAVHAAITWEGTFHNIEYNEIYNVCNASDDCGAIYSYNSYAKYGTVISYNYIHDISCQVESLMKLKDYPYCHTAAIYIDGGLPGQTVHHNILENVSGCGVSSSGRDELISNNLFISCGWGVSLPSTHYYDIFVAKTATGMSLSHQGLADKQNNEDWKKTFPNLFSMNWKNPDPTDPNYAGNPANVVVKDNYYFFDKANIRSLAGYGHIFQNHYDEPYYTFNPDTLEDAVENVNMEMYSSKREPITVEEAIEKTTNVTGITLEIFAEIGKH